MSIHFESKMIADLEKSMLIHFSSLLIIRVDALAGLQKHFIISSEGIFVNRNYWSNSFLLFYSASDEVPVRTEAKPSDFSEVEREGPSPPAASSSEEVEAVDVETVRRPHPRPTYSDLPSLLGTLFPSGPLGPVNTHRFIWNLRPWWKGYVFDPLLAIIELPSKFWDIKYHFLGQFKCVDKLIDVCPPNLESQRDLF